MCMRVGGTARALSFGVTELNLRLGTGARGISGAAWDIRRGAMARDRADDMETECVRQPVVVRIGRLLRLKCRWTCGLLLSRSWHDVKLRFLDPEEHLGRCDLTVTFTVVSPVWLCRNRPVNVVPVVRLVSLLQELVHVPMCRVTRCEASYRGNVDDSMVNILNLRPFYPLEKWCSLPDFLVTSFYALPVP